ncbi:techylectin-5B [Aplysia californica]|uniref:Techylectin-5B n=1 Tax=Aplysia californica TaxID=6500 RepID=A0ABM0KBD8_APLCA|nr:techylectin-5B [Aplysia californica]
MDANWASRKLILAAALFLSSSACVLNVTTPEVEVGQTANVSLECFNLYPIPDVSDIFVMRILKWDHDEWNSVAEIKSGDDAEVRQKSKDVFVEGKIGSVAESFLRLTWPVATNDTLGQYRCDLVSFTLQENVLWLKSLPLLVTRKGDLTVQMLSEIVEQNQNACFQQLSSQKQDILENITATAEVLEARSESQLKNQLQVLSDMVEEYIESMKAIVEKTKKEFLQQIGDLGAGSGSEIQPKPCAGVQGPGPRPVVVLSSGMKVVCDTQTDNGGWVVFQRRASADVDFYRRWEDYKNGFGNLSGNFWLGLEKVHQLTSQGRYEMRIDMTFEGKDYYASYKNFSLSGESENYKIYISGFSGNVEDNLDFHNGSMFSTKDRDNDHDYAQHCAEQFHGGWWYHVGCFHACLNGEWGSTVRAKGLHWVHLTGYTASVSLSEMKIRPHP